MGIIFILKCFLIPSSLIYSKNLVETTDTSSPTSPGSGAGAGSGTKTGVELSLKATAGTDQFDYSKNDKIVTYTAKDKYGFKSVKTGDTVVWSTDKASEYATKVVLNGKGNKKKTVIIYMPNGKKKAFKKENKNKPWNEVSLSDKDPAKTASTKAASGASQSVAKENANWALNRQLKGGI